MSKVKILVSIIIVSVCIQSLATTVSVFADTEETSTVTTEETTATEPQTEAKKEAVSTTIPETQSQETLHAAEESKTTETVEMETVEVSLLQNGSTNPNDYSVRNVAITKEEVAAGEIERKAAPSSSMEDFIASGMDKHTSRIDISGFGVSNSEASKKKVFKTIIDAINNNPRLFFIGNKMTIGSAGGKVLAVYPEYTKPQAEADQLKQQFDAAVNDALKSVNSAMNTSQKAKAIHDYIALNAEYDMVNYKRGSVPIDSYRANGVLVKGVGVCQSYAMAYKYILEEKLGIKCTYASTETHIWNLVKIDGKFYNADVTWDDTIKNKITYDFFLVSKATMANAHKGENIYFESAPSTVDFGTPSSVNLKSVKAGQRKAEVTWSKNNSAGGYEVYFSAKKTAKYKKIKTISKNKVVKYTKKSLKKGKKYYFKVRAYKVINGKKVYGSYSSIKSTKVK